MYRIVESVCCIPETNITLYVNYTGKEEEKENENEKKGKKKKKGKKDKIR